MHKFIAALIVPTFIALLALWTSAAKAETWLEGACTARPMAQGKAGEWVTTCELTRVASVVTAAPTRHVAHTSKPRATRLAKDAKDSCSVSRWSEGTRVACTTVVARLGARTPTRIMVARLDADGTCGGLPAACCSVHTGTAALCKLTH